MSAPHAGQGALVAVAARQELGDYFDEVADWVGLGFTITVPRTACARAGTQRGRDAPCAGWAFLGQAVKALWTFAHP
eukprot:326897-Alexandrium_andersonii.AAC.1